MPRRRKEVTLEILFVGTRIFEELEVVNLCCEVNFIVVNSLRVAVGARVCQCVGVSICVATPNPEGFCCVGDGNN